MAIKKQSPGLRLAKPKAIRGQEPLDYLLVLAAVLVVLAIVIYFVTSTAESESTPERDYTTIEGRIVEIKTGEKLVLIWENDDGTFAIRFSYTSEILPIGANIKLTYFQTQYGSRIIENVGWLW